VHAVRQSRGYCNTQLDRAGQQLAGDAAMSPQLPSNASHSGRNGAIQLQLIAIAAEARKEAY
jgi:hypothetical protein